MKYLKNIIKNKAKKKIKNIKFICRRIINTTEEFSYTKYKYKYKYEHICTHNHETDDKFEDEFDKTFEDDNDDEYMYIFKRTRKQERTYHY